MRGFTLIESVFYIALFALVMEGALTGIFAISESSNRNQTKAGLEMEGEFIESRISYEFSQGQPINFATDNFMEIGSSSVVESKNPTSLYSAFIVSSKTVGGEKLSESFSRTYYLPL